MTADPAPRRRALLPIGLIVVLVVGIAVAVAVANGAFGGSSAGATPAASVPGVVPADSGVVAEGRAVPVRAVELQVGAPGIVASLPVAEGAAVAAGDVLLSLDTTAADAEVAAATASLDAATAGVAQAEASLDQAEAGADAAQRGAEEAAAARRGAIAARNALPGSASNAQEDQADAQVDQATAALERARDLRTQANAAVRGARAAVEAAQADLARAAAAAASATAAREQLVIAAPFPGTVVSVAPVVGERVQPGAVLVRLADLREWRFETNDLSETSVARVAVGAPATVTVDGIPGTGIEGTVESVGGYGSSVQGDITFPVIIAPTGAVPDGLRWNMTVTIEIDGDDAGG
jgi:multidrug resistance efflux pump